jgi:ADP-ribose pyrophosphatase
VLFTVKDRVSTQQIHNGDIVGLRVDTVRSKDGEVTREVVEHSGGVCIACKPSPDEVFLVKQYRYSVDQELLELPAGRVNPGEDRLEAAKRELIEEVGYRANSWTELPPFYTAPGFCNELLTCYLAEDLSWVGTDPDDDEEISVFKMKLDDAWQLVINREIRDCKTIAILGMLKSAPARF